MPLSGRAGSQRGGLAAGVKLEPLSGRRELSHLAGARRTLGEGPEGCDARGMFSPWRKLHQHSVVDAPALAGECFRACWKLPRTAATIYYHRRSS